MDATEEQTLDQAGLWGGERMSGVEFGWVFKRESWQNQVAGGVRKGSFYGAEARPAMSDRSPSYGQGAFVPQFPAAPPFGVSASRARIRKEDRAGSTA